MLSGVQKDVFSLIIKYLPIASVLNMDRTCRRFHNVLIDLRYFDILRRQIVQKIPDDFCETHKKRCKNVKQCDLCFKRNCLTCCTEQCMFCDRNVIQKALRECQICDRQLCTGCCKQCKSCGIIICSKCRRDGHCRKCEALICFKCKFNVDKLFLCKICKVNHCSKCFHKVYIFCPLNHPEVCKVCLVEKNKSFI